MYTTNPTWTGLRSAIDASNYRLCHDTAISYAPLLQKSAWHIIEAGTAQLIKWMATHQCLIAIVGRDLFVFITMRPAPSPRLLVLRLWGWPFALTVQNVQHSLSTSQWPYTMWRQRREIYLFIIQNGSWIFTWNCRYMTVNIWNCQYMTLSIYDTVSLTSFQKGYIFHFKI